MKFNEYQDLAGETDLGHPLNYYFLGLSEEAGEVAGLRKRFLRDEGNIDYDKMKKELGDVLWYIARLGHRYNISLDDIALSNISKLQDRKQRGVICGAGDNRQDLFICDNCKERVDDFVIDSKRHLMCPMCGFVLIEK